MAKAPALRLPDRATPHAPARRRHQAPAEPGGAPHRQRLHQPRPVGEGRGDVVPGETVGLETLQNGDRDPDRGKQPDSPPARNQRGDGRRDRPQNAEIRSHPDQAPDRRQLRQPTVVVHHGHHPVGGDRPEDGAGQPPDAPRPPLPLDPFESLRGAGSETRGPTGRAPGPARRGPERDRRAPRGAREGRSSSEEYTRRHF